MRDRDRANPAEFADRLDGRVVDHSEAVPQQVALRRANKQRALAYGKRRLGSDPSKAAVVAHLVAMFLAEIVKGRPALPRPTDVLPLVFTDRALLRRPFGRSELDAAGCADIVRHVAVSPRVPLSVSSRIRVHGCRRRHGRPGTPRPRIRAALRAE